MKTHNVHRMQPLDPETNPVEGEVRWSPVKSIWFSTFLVIATVGGYYTFSLEAVSVGFITTSVTLCLGHTIGLHRLLIHRSFECPRWFEWMLVHLGTLVGMGGPMQMLYLHDIRDWSQRHPDCHTFFIHRHAMWKDFLWQLHGTITLKHPPRFIIEPRVGDDPVHRFMQRTWMLQQLPLATLLFVLGGASWLVWGVAVRITVSLIGHWLVGYLAHNHGERQWHLEGHAVQGYNLGGLGMLAMGEGWHNNHHAFPESARLGLLPGQIDIGWCVLRGLRRIGLVWNLRLPADLPPRPELCRLDSGTI